VSIINHQYEHTFIHIPKCAGHSMQSNDWVGNKCHTTVNDYIKEGTWRDDYFSWTFVRNPYDRLLSSYFWIKKSNYDLQKWHNGMSQQDISTFANLISWLEKSDINKDVLFKPQYLHIINQNDNISVGFIGRFESIVQDWSYITNTILGKQCDLLHKNKTSHNHYTQYYTDELKERIYTLYAKDFALFSYKK